MVKVTSTTPPVTPGVSGSGTVNPVQPAAPDRSLSKEDKPFVERRKNPDRRKDAGERGPYEMRSGKDRRKNNRGRPHIDIDA